jgi:CRP-like cAMP-binding protein
MDATPAILAKALVHARSKHIFKNQILLYEGDISPDVMAIKSGIVKVHDIDNQGNEKILHLLKCPALFPFAFFTGGDAATRWYYTALTDCEIQVMPKQELRDLIANDPELGIHLMNWFSREMHEVLTRLGSLSKTVARDKVEAALAFLAVWHSEKRRGNWKRVTFPVSHQLLADMTGITRESATLTMRELQAEKVVRAPRTTTLEINPGKLAAN